MQEIDILNDLMNNLDAIEVEAKLDNSSLINAICSMFLNRGNNLLYVFSESNLGWIYFQDHQLVASYTNESSDYDALGEITSWDDINVKEYRNVEIVEFQISLGITDFMSMIHKDIKFPENHETLTLELDGIDGAVCFQGEQMIFCENMNKESIPLDFLKSLADVDHDDRGVLIAQNENYFFVYRSELRFWVLSLDKSPKRLSEFDTISESIKELDYAT